MKAENIIETVANAIKNGNETVQTNVINSLVNKELDRRADAIVKGLDSFNKLNLEIKKVKPDVVAFDADGKQIGEGTYTKAAADKLKQSKEKAGKIERALNKALENGDYGDLFNLNSNSGNNDSPKPSGDSK